MIAISSATRRTLFGALVSSLCGTVQATTCEAERGCLQNTDRNHPRPALVFIHGSPGSAKQFRRFVDDPLLARHWDLYALDRPGYGHSPAPFTPDLQRQAQDLLAQLPQQPLTLVGHSLGGTVALWMAVLAPERVAQLVLLAASVSPEHEQPRWFNRWAALAPIRWVLPRSWRQSNIEILALASELEPLLARAAHLRVPLLIVQGERDGLVHPASPFTLIAQLPETVLLEHQRWERSGHLFPWTQYSRTRELFMTLTTESL